MTKVPAIFLDRDGTINVDKQYVHRIEEFEFEQGAAEAIAKLNAAGYKVIVITNQAGIARGYYQERDVHKLHQWINNELAKHDAHIDQFYYCPHHPEYGEKQHCNCRKPAAGLIEQAVREYSIDISRSFLVGDKVSDIQAGMSVGLISILVLTGYGMKAKDNFVGKLICANNLHEAVTKYILKNERNTV